MMRVRLREQALRAERLAKHAERSLLLQTTRQRQRTEAQDDSDVRSLRSADAASDAPD